MSTFTSPLDVRFIDGKWWELLEDFEYYVDDNKEVLIKVPAGFKTDFASIPRILWSLFTHHDIFNKAAIVHDYLCGTYGDMGRFTEEQIHIIFYEALLVIGIPAWKAKIMWKSVDMFAEIKGNALSEEQLKQYKEMKHDKERKRRTA